MIYLGIDPGIHGAVATSEGWVEHLPIQGEAGDRTINVRQLHRLLYPHAQGAAICAIERQWKRPRGGAKSARSSGQMYGGLRAVLELLSIPYFQVPPHVWKRAMGISSAKSEAIELAADEFGRSQVLGGNGKPDDNLAEALLLARYAEVYLASRPEARK